ncbi:MAG: EAL and HDOD domain-containing protein [Solirubrobacteraceae bacterium]
MSEASLARQPIFDRGLNVIGYELLFRSLQATEARFVDDATATTMVVINALTEIGLERIVGRKRAWINVSRDFLLSGLISALPPDLVCLEILEDQTIDAPLIEALVDLKRHGYRLALDDFEFTPAAVPLLELADIVKLDFIALGRRGIAEHAARLSSFNAILLAEKIESRDDHRSCLEAGCGLFQGYFYRRPELMSNRRIDANRISILALLAGLQDPALEFSDLERLIGSDIGLSLRLLRYINSAYFGLRHRVSSIGQALTLLGSENLRRWATLSIFAGVDGKPSELTVIALLRAHFCELTGVHLRGANPSQLFTLGLFSVIDALMDMPIQDVLAEIPFPDDMRAALITHTGEMGTLLECVNAIEDGDFERAERLVCGCSDRYVDSITWVNHATDQMFDDAAAA